jgi:hypothetical protein
MVALLSLGEKVFCGVRSFLLFANLAEAETEPDTHQ